MRLLVLTPTPQMHCENCENKIKDNMRFEKGLVKIETSVPNQTVSLTYNARKTSPDKLRAAMKKIGYDTRIVSDTEIPTAKKKTTPQPTPQGSR